MATPDKEQLYHAYTSSTWSAQQQPQETTPIHSHTNPVSEAIATNIYKYPRHTRSLLSALHSPSEQLHTTHGHASSTVSRPQSANASHASRHNVSPTCPKAQPRMTQVDLPRRPASARRARPGEGLTKPPFTSKSLSLEHPRHKHDLAYTTKPIGDPLVRELNPVSPSQVIRLKHRAATLIQRYAGSNWQTAQRTKWMLDVVTHIDKDYREYLMDQATQIHHLQDQIQLMQSSHANVLAITQTKVNELEALAREQQAQLREQAATVLDLQTRLRETEATLQIAEQAATATADEMAELHQTVSSVTEHDARARKLLANRAYTLKESLRGSQAKLRHSTEVARRHDIEVGAMLQLKQEELARDKAALSSQFMGQIAAVHMVERAAAQIEVDKLRMELDAYKEPWTYTYGKISPTRNKELSKTLGLKPGSLNTIMPPA